MMDKKKKHFLRAENQIVSVEEVVYKNYYKMARRDKYLEESDILHGKVSYNTLDTDEYSGEEILIDTSVDVEEIVINRIMLETLRKCLLLLNDDEQRLINELYYKGKSETAVAKLLGISQQAVSKRNIKILNKLHKLIKI